MTAVTNSSATGVLWIKKNKHGAMMRRLLCEKAIEDQLKVLKKRTYRRQNAKGQESDEKFDALHGCFFRCMEFLSFLSQFFRFVGSTRMRARSIAKIIIVSYPHVHRVVNL